MKTDLFPLKVSCSSFCKTSVINASEFLLQKNCTFDSIDGRKNTSRCNAIVVAVVTSAAIDIGTAIAITATRDNNSDNCALLCSAFILLLLLLT